MFHIQTSRLDYMKGKQMHIWIDIETTGLDPKNDRILEIAWFTTDRNLNETTSYNTSFVHNDYQTVQDLLESNPNVLRMHTESGLLANMATAYAGERGQMLMLSDIEDLIIKDLPHRKEWVLSGASVHFDRSFIAEYMPRLDDHLSHRHLDTSSIRTMMKACNVGYPDVSLGTKHRAMDDIIETHAMARAYYKYVESTVPLMVAQALPPKEEN